jgi:hypothetical protein
MRARFGVVGSFPRVALKLFRLTTGMLPPSCMLFI